MPGASIRELMGRMGHASMDAAIIYQHRTADRDRAIADSMDAMLQLIRNVEERLNGEADGHGEGTATG